MLTHSEWNCRTRISVRFMWAAFAALTLSIPGCQEAEDIAQREDDSHLVAACDSLTQAFMTALKSELTLAVQEGGLTHAVQVCKITAPDIAAEFSRREGWSIRRVSVRYRNPENAPDDYETTVLAAMTADDGPQVFHEWHRQASGDSTFVYFKAIRAAEFCLGCHGPREMLSPDIRVVLEQEYPEDLATGYSAGDLRGAFVVQVQFPEAAL